jgi:DNA modification methylase
MLGNRQAVIFRDLMPEIPSTTYATFGLYKYPAKFIPQVIAYALTNYGRPGMSVIDPFAGYGTVGMVARLCGTSSIPKTSLTLLSHYQVVQAK